MTTYKVTGATPYRDHLPGDEFEAERNQWDDGNNVVALSPGTVVACEPSVLI